MAGVPFLETEFVEPIFAFYLDNLVDGKLTTGSLHGSFSCAPMETTHEVHPRRRRTRMDSEHRSCELV